MPRLTVAAVSTQLRRLKGNLSAVARHFKVTRQAVQQFLGRHDSLAAVVTEAREALVDRAESKLDSAVGRGEKWAVVLVLKTLGKGRGYIEKSELDVTERVRQRVVEEVVEGEDGGHADPPAPGTAAVPTK